MVLENTKTISLLNVATIIHGSKYIYIVVLDCMEHFLKLLTTKKETSYLET